MAPDAGAFRLLTVRQANEKSVRIKNQLTDQIQLLDLELRQTEDGRAGLRALLGDRSSTVRLRAALAVLAFDRDIAVDAIEQVRQGDDGPAWEAAVAESLASATHPTCGDRDDPFRELDDRYLALPDVQDSIEDAV